MNRYKCYSAGIACLFSIITAFTGGCVTQEKDPAVKQTPVVSSLAKEQALGEKMIKALRDNDSNTFLSLLHKDTRIRFGKKEFEDNRAEMKKLFGEIVSVQYLTALEMPTLHPMIWKLRFCRKAQQKDAAPIYQETLFQIIFGLLDGKPYVLSFGFL